MAALFQIPAFPKPKVIVLWKTGGTIWGNFAGLHGGSLRNPANKIGTQDRTDCSTDCREEGGRRQKEREGEVADWLEFTVLGWI